MWPGPTLREGQTDGLGATSRVGTQPCRSLGKPHRPHAVEAWSSEWGSGSPSGPPDGRSADLVTVGTLGEVEQRPLPRDRPLWAWCREHGDR